MLSFWKFRFLCIPCGFKHSYILLLSFFTIFHHKDKCLGCIVWIVSYALICASKDGIILGKIWSIANHFLLTEERKLLKVEIMVICKCRGHSGGKEYSRQGLGLTKHGPQTLMEQRNLPCKQPVKTPLGEMCM